MTRLGSFIENSSIKRAVDPAARSAAVNGVGINRLGFRYAWCAIAVGATTGSPTSFTVDAKVQESDDDSTYTDVTGATMTQITAANQVGEIGLNLEGRKKFIRLVITPAFTGGTSPTVECCGVICLTDPTESPKT